MTTNSGATLNRRMLMAGGMTLFGAAAAAAPAWAVKEADLFPVADTQYGKIRGISWTGVHAFKGVPYGASTSGKNRWMPPKAPASWKGEKECFDYGMISPQVTTDRRSEYSSLIMWDRHVGGMGEDMLTLNVWSRVVKDDGGKRPVFVSFHGGGYTTGSGNAPGRAMAVDESGRQQVPAALLVGDDQEYVRRTGASLGQCQP